MFNVSFGSNYKINVGRNFPEEAKDEIFEYEFKGGKIFEKYNNYEEIQRTNTYSKLNVCLPDKYDINFETYLLSKGIDFRKETVDEALNLDNIRKRMTLPSWAKNSQFKLVEIDTNKLNELFRKDKISYIEPNGINGIAERYDGVGEYLKTGQPINSPLVYIWEDNGELCASINDGRHRFAYLRDIGMKKIPVAINKESYNIAKKYGLI